MSSITSARGFTLFETLVATGILVTALAGVAQLFVLGTQLTRQATASGAALVAAQDKVESLRALAFGYDEAGTPVTGSGLQSSPESSLDEDLESYADWIDTEGRASGAGDAAMFVRRWRVSPIGNGSPDAIAIEACVFRMPAEGRNHLSAEACLSTVRTRQP